MTLIRISKFFRQKCEHVLTPLSYRHKQICASVSTSMTLENWAEKLLQDLLWCCNLLNFTSLN